MIDTYEDYISMPLAMPATKMTSIHQQMIDELDCLPDAVELYNELIEAAIKYAEIRAKWAIMDREQKIEKDSYRTSLHNAFILQINILARFLRKSGKPALWRDELGDEEADSIFRKVIGDFACYLAFIDGICAR